MIKMTLAEYLKAKREGTLPTPAPQKSKHKRKRKKADDG